ncbi:DUF4283 domain protein [Trifolium medium]|uniref:DUF4283 domain protein n=1 Tax=Trifolium medium TaxID=97028 RepID=A0A392LX08_9FABA|nr:DUF4283 domain protein [Trifolium medium]
MSRRLANVWSGTFKLRINHSRFERNAERKNGTTADREKGGEGVSRQVEQELSFREALIPSSFVMGVSGGDMDKVVVKVPVDSSLLQNLKRSFVGFLVPGAEVRTIRTTLLMEGLQNITVTTMGGNMVLLHSSKLGELEGMIKDKEEWLSYYFFDVKPWSPNLVNDKREVWVKVFGIPLHVWGDSLFKVLGARFGEFVDYDEETASRTRLDVARLKFSTTMRNFIEAPVKILVMGVAFEVWVVEEKEERRFIGDQGRDMGGDRSYGGSSAFPAKAMVVGGEDVVFSGEDEVSVDLGPCQHLDRPKDLERDKTCLFEDLVQHGFRKSNHGLDLGKEIMSDVGEGLEHKAGVEGDLGGARGEVVSVAKEDGVALEESCENYLKTIIKNNKEVEEGVSKDVGPSGLVLLLQNNENEMGLDNVQMEEGLLDRSTVKDVNKDVGRLQQSEPNKTYLELSSTVHPSASREIGSSSPSEHSTASSENFPFNPVGAREESHNEMVFSSLSETQSFSQQISQEDQNQAPKLKKHGGRNKLPQGCGPKCLQLVEALKEGRGGGRRRRVRGAVEAGRSRSVPVLQGAVRNDLAFGTVEALPISDSSIVERNIHLEGLNLEVILPGPTSTPNIGLRSSPFDELSQVPESPVGSVGADGYMIREATTILGIQKQVGFSFSMSEANVRKLLVDEEVTDRSNMVGREQNNGDQ